MTTTTTTTIADSTATAAAAVVEQPVTNPSDLLKRAEALKLYGLVEHWSDVKNTDWIKNLITWEEAERSQRSLERRLTSARLGRFKTLGEFDWNWPEQCDRNAIEECMKLGFMKDVSNVILCGPNGVGKSTIARNLAHQTIMEGHTALFVTAGAMLNDLVAQDGDQALSRRIKHYARPDVLVIDELGYLSYSNRHADLLFEIVARRYELKATIITTNKPFSEWNDIFPNAACVVSLIDRLVHHSDIINIVAKSYRLKEAKEKSEQRKKTRTKKAETTKSKK